MRVFFGGSIPGYIEAKSNYEKIRRLILQGGNVLTRDWLEEENRGLKRSSSEMIDLTQKALSISDAAIIEASKDISAVGLQIQLSVDRSLPTLVLYNKDKVKDGDILGRFFIDNKYRKLIKLSGYNSKTLTLQVSSFLKWAQTSRKVVRFNLEIDREQDEYLKALAAKHKSNKSEEIRRLISEAMIVEKK